MLLGHLECSATAIGRHFQREYNDQRFRRLSILVGQLLLQFERVLVRRHARIGPGSVFVPDRAAIGAAIGFDRRYARPEFAVRLRACLRH